MTSAADHQADPRHRRLRTYNLVMGLLYAA